EHLARLLLGFGPANRLARSAGLPTIGVSHGTVFGSVSEHGVPMAGFDHEFTTGALFAAEAQAFMLGHIHRHQFWDQVGKVGRQLVAYAGSIGRFHYGEDGDKGFLLWDVDAASASAALVPTPARRTVDIVFEGRPDLAALREALEQKDVSGASVRVRWTVGEEDRSAVDRDAIQRMLAGAAETKLEGRIVPVVRTRAAGISRLSNLADKLRAWARISDVNAEPLLACLAELSEESPDDISERLLRGEGSRTADAESAVRERLQPGPHSAADPLEEAEASMM
ncbi:MAG: metallophosphatase family protein, partial [Hydrogenophaga sp.]|nr:metallophosphatase family protein [Hydrogenophaga sp.]